MSHVLVLEDDQIFLTQLNQSLRKELPDFTILPARDIDEAEILTSEYQIQFHILDLELEDGHGFEFLCDVKTTNPDAIAILITATLTDEIRGNAQRLNALRVLEKPVAAESITKLLLRALDTPTSEQPSDSQFQASLSCLTSLDIIQLKCQSRSTQVLQFSNSARNSGKIHFDKGQIIHAETSDLSGIDAFHELLSWQGGSVMESNELVTSAPTITTDWQTLLLESAQFIDESQAQKSS